MAARTTNPPQGIAFQKQANGERSSTALNKQAWADATKAADGELAKKILAEEKWRYKYTYYAKEHVKVALKSSDNAIAMATAGLASMYKNMTFIRGDSEVSFEEALKKYNDQPFSTGFIQGGGKRVQGAQLTVPYKGKSLSGQALHDQLDKWARYGTIEPDTAAAIKAVSASVDLSQYYFVLLGAGAAMGPFITLMNMGANVIALDIDRDFVWKRLIKIARESPGTMIFPLKAAVPANASDDELAAQAGCDLMAQTPEVCNWVESLHGKYRNMVIGTYVYLDGEAHIRVALAADAVVRRMTEKFKVPIAYLCTPTDLHVVPEGANKAAKQNFSSMSPANLVLTLIRLLSFGKVLKPNYGSVPDNEGKPFHYVDGLVVPQGPNYALAKRMQHWRVIAARQAGSVVSSHIAPATATRSVISNRTFAWAYDGMPFIKPYEIFEEGTSNAVMAALLINDLQDPKGPAQPNYKLRNPYELFSYNGFHGGTWRAGYKYESIGFVAVMIHFVKVGRPVIAALLALAVYFAFFR